MLNQVTIEGYLTRTWEYRGRRYLRLANHRPELQGLVSDYLTVQVDPSLPYDPGQMKPGRLVQVSGRLTGRDILEPLGSVVAKSGLTVDLPAEAANKMLVRPTVEVMATSVKVLKDPRRKPRHDQPRGNRVDPKVLQQVQPGVDTSHPLSASIAALLTPSRCPSGSESPAEITTTAK